MNQGTSLHETPGHIERRLAMSKDHIPYRQIHLDFHTSPEIPGVGSRFNADEFVGTLKGAHVNSINLFTKCHHGMFYYPSSVGPMHPALNGFDLFGAQIEACHAAGIRVMAYTCVGWNEYVADTHPDWLMVTFDGLVGNKLPHDAGFNKWNTLCYNNSDYRVIIKQEIAETFEKYHPAGFWIDIIQGHECVCPQCKREMLKMGMDPSDRSEVIRHDRMTETAFCKDIYEYVKSLDSGLDVYFNAVPYALDNGLDEATSSVTKRKYFSFWDIESLPSEDWGYNHFPIAASYIGKYDSEITMMNGKFHFTWGDFGSLRNENALEYECFRALSYGAKVCVGDQLHPTGRLDPVVYERIGRVFASIEAKEPWLHNTRALADIGVFITSNNSNDPASPSLIEEGVYRVLLESHMPFEFVNDLDPIDKYKLLILPDHFYPTKELAERLDEFVRKGGKLLITGDSATRFEDGGVSEAESRTSNNFVLECVKEKLCGPSDYDMRYIRLGGECFEGIPGIDHIMYEKGYVIAVESTTDDFADDSADDSADGAVDSTTDNRVAAWIVNPYFNRTYDHFCSHRQTPPRTDASNEPAVVFGDGYAIISSPLFTDYIRNGYLVHRQIAERVIRKLLPEQLVRTSLPAISEITVRKKCGENAYDADMSVVNTCGEDADNASDKNTCGADAVIVHILNYIQQKRNKRIEIIEDKYTAIGRNICVRVGNLRPGSVRLVPDNVDLPFTYEDGYVCIELPEISGHTMLEICDA